MSVEESKPLRSPARGPHHCRWGNGVQCDGTPHGTGELDGCMKLRGYRMDNCGCGWEKDPEGKLPSPRDPLESPIMSRIERIVDTDFSVIERHVAAYYVRDREFPKRLTLLLCTLIATVSLFISFYF